MSHFSFINRPCSCLSGLGWTLAHVSAEFCLDLCPLSNVYGITGTTELFFPYLPEATTIWDIVGHIPFPFLGMHGLSRSAGMNDSSTLVSRNVQPKNRPQALFPSVVPSMQVLMSSCIVRTLSQWYSLAEVCVGLRILILICIQWGNEMPLSLLERWGIGCPCSFLKE